MVKSPSYALVDSKQSRLFDMDGNFPIPINIVILFSPYITCTKDNQSKILIFIITSLLSYNLLTVTKFIWCEHYYYKEFLLLQSNEKIYIIILRDLNFHLYPLVKT